MKIKNKKYDVLKGKLTKKIVVKKLTWNSKIKSEEHFTKWKMMILEVKSKATGKIKNDKKCEVLKCKLTWN